jgi:glutamate racemase
VAVIDSASATASALAGLLEIHGLGAPAGAEVRHELYTTGDVERFSATASRLFGAEFADVRRLALDETTEPVSAARSATAS